MAGRTPAHDWLARLREELSTPAFTPETDVLEELAQHAQATYDAARAAGESHTEASARVDVLIARWKVDPRALRRRRTTRTAAVPVPTAHPGSPLAGLTHDVVYAIRRVRRSPRLAVLVVLTLALGAGPTSVLFSVAYGVLVKPLPWTDADRLVVLEETRGGRAPRFGSITNAAYVAWQEQAATIEGLAAWRTTSATLSGAGDPERIRLTASTASLFALLGVQPIAGTLYQSADEKNRVIVLSEGLWRSRFAGDAAAIGRSIRLDGQPYTVVGVVSERAMFPDRRSRAWMPFEVRPATGNLLSLFEGVAKLKPGITADVAAAEGTARGRFAADTGPTTMAIFGGDGPPEVSVQSLTEAMTGEVRRPLIVLLCAVALLLVIATMNVASLQLATAAARGRELAIRAAIGAGAGRIVRQVVVEHVVLGIAGAAAGLALAWGMYRTAVRVLPADFPRLEDLSFDVVALGAAAATSVAASLLAALLPAWRMRRLDIAALAREGSSPVGLGVRTALARSRLAIVGVQIAACCVLLVGASLLGRSFLAMLHADRGFDAAAVMSAGVPMTGSAYTPERRLAILQQIVDRLRAWPGVESAAFTSESPATPGGSTSSLTLPARDGSPPVRVQASPRLVSAGYFETLGLRVLIGRTLRDTDTATSQPVAVVNETFARRYLGAAPLDGRIPMGVWGSSRAAAADAAIVGVVEDVRYVDTAVTTLPEMYFPSRQVPVGIAIGTLLVRGNRMDAHLAGGIRAAVREADASIVPMSVMTIEDRLVATSLARPRLYATLLGLFAAVAIAVAGVGLFGVLSYVVAQRTRELALRSALGASRTMLVWLVLRQATGVAAVGIAGGLLLSLWLTRGLAALLHGITSGDPTTYALVPALLLLVVGAACVAPARIVARVDPLHALRSEPRF